jgi:hypothetical protein
MSKKPIFLSLKYRAILINIARHKLINGFVRQENRLHLLNVVFFFETAKGPKKQEIYGSLLLEMRRRHYGEDGKQGGEEGKNTKNGERQGRAADTSGLANRNRENQECCPHENGSLLISHLAQRNMNSLGRPHKLRGARGKNSLRLAIVRQSSSPKNHRYDDDRMGYQYLSAFVRNGGGLLLTLNQPGYP